MINSTIKKTIIISFMAFLSLAWVNFHLKQRISLYQKNIKECSAILKQIETAKEQLKKNSSKFSEYHSIINRCVSLKYNQVKWSKILNRIATELPETMWLEKLSIRRKKFGNQFVRVSSFNRSGSKDANYHVELYGRTTDRGSIDNFLLTLDTFPRFKYPSITHLNNQNDIWQYLISTYY